MAAVAIWAVMVLAFQASTATTDTRNDHHVNLQNKLASIRDDALKSIEFLSLDNVEKRRAIVSDASEFAYKIEKTIHKIFQNFVRVNERDNDRNLPEVALTLNNIVHQVQDVLITKPAQLQEILKENVHQVYVVSERLRKILQNLEDNDDNAEMKNDINDIIEKLVDAMHQLQIRGELHQHTNEEIGTFHQKFGTRIIDTLNQIHSQDQHTLDHLITSETDFLNFLNHIIDYLGNEFARYRGYNRNLLGDICANLKRIRSYLGGAVKKHPWGDLKRVVKQLIFKIRLVVYDYDIQVQKLAAMGKGSENDSSLINSVKTVIADSVQAEQRMLWKLEEIINGHEKINK